MENRQFIMFFTIVLAVHLLVNIYITIRGYQALEAFPRLRPWFILFMIVAASSYFAGRILERSMYNPLSISLHWLGAFWFAVMLYATLQLFLIDLARLVNLVVPFIHRWAGGDYPGFKMTVGIVVTGITIGTVLAGHINAWYPRVSELTLTIDKEANGLKELRIAAVSDIHLGTIIGPRKTAKMVNTLNGLKPDIILLPGDILDEDVKPVIEQNLGKCLNDLQAPMGVFGSTGNHEYIGGGDPSVRYLEEHGINMLRDTAILIQDAFYLVGREDLQARRLTGHPRKKIEELLEGLDLSRPVIMLDHQPYNLDLVAGTGVDLQLSGHTHHGQMWPFGYITQMIFEVSRGYKRKGDAHFYVSTGFGTWGPPVRTGNRPEVVVINVKFSLKPHTPENGHYSPRGSYYPQNF